MKRDRYETVAWILFVFSAFGFIAASVRAGDMIALVASLFFLVACLVFLWPERWR